MSSKADEFKAGHLPAGVFSECSVLNVQVQQAQALGINFVYRHLALTGIYTRFSFLFMVYLPSY